MTGISHSKSENSLAIVLIMWAVNMTQKCLSQCMYCTNMEVFQILRHLRTTQEIYQITYTQYTVVVSFVLLKLV